MKMVAAAKLRRAQENIFKTRPYAYKLGEIVGHLKKQGKFTPDAHQLFASRETVATTLWIVVTADRGLAGAFNSNIIKAAEQSMGKMPGTDHRLLVVGRKGHEHFSRRGHALVGDYRGVFRDLAFRTAQKIGEVAVAGFLASTWDQVHLIYNEFRNTISQNRIVEPLLPIPPEHFLTPAMEQEGVVEPQMKKRYTADYIFEPDGHSILHVLLPRYLNYTLWRALLESHAAEQGARMVAMDNATSNADELLRALRLQYNRARQSAITTEILEIISGANALEQR